MTSISDNSERRRFHRNSSPRVILIIDERPFLAKDWSPDGFKIDFPNSGLSANDILTGEIDIFEIKEIGQFEATVIQAGDNGMVACKFTNLSSHAYMNLCLTVAVPEQEYQE